MPVVMSRFFTNLIITFYSYWLKLKNERVNFGGGKTQCQNVNPQKASPPYFPLCENTMGLIY